MPTTSQSGPLPDTAANRQRLVMWLVLTLSIGMYFALAEMSQPAQAHKNRTLVDILLMAALALVTASFPAKSRLLAGLAASNNPAQLRGTALLVAMVCCEAAALLGLVVWFTTGWHYYYVFLLLGLVGQLAHYPGRQEEP